MLRNWSLTYCILNSYTGSDDLWSKSNSGTNEYYFTGSLSEEPESLLENERYMDKGTIGSLSVGEWGYGNNDSLGKNTIYVRLSDESDPDTKSSGYIQSPKYNTVLQTVSENETVLFSILISNKHSKLFADIEFAHTTENDVVYFNWSNKVSPDGSPLVINSRICLNPGDKIKIKSSLESVNVLISGDET